MTNQGHYFNVSKRGREDRYFTWSSEPHEGLPVYRAKVFLSYSKSPKVQPTTSRSAANDPTCRGSEFKATFKSLKCYEGGSYESSEAQMSKLR